jgi:hypothetical protein
VKNLRVAAPPAVAIYASGLLTAKFLISAAVVAPLAISAPSRPLKLGRRSAPPPYHWVALSARQGIRVVSNLGRSVALGSREFTNRLTELRIKNLEKILRASFFELSHAKCMIHSKTAK